MSRGFDARIFEGLVFHLQLIGAVDRAAKIRATLETHGARYCPDPCDPRCLLIIVFPPEERRALSYRYTGKEAPFNYIWTYEQICIRFARRDSGRPDPERQTRKRVVQASWVNACFEREAFLMDNHCDKWEIVTKDCTPLPSVAGLPVPSGASGVSSASALPASHTLPPPSAPPASHSLPPPQLGPDGHFTPPPESSTLSTPRKPSDEVIIPVNSKSDTVLSVFRSRPSATSRFPVEAAKDPRLAHNCFQPRSITLLGVLDGDGIPEPSKVGPDVDSQVLAVFRPRPSPAVSVPFPKDPRLAHKFFKPRSTSLLGALEEDDISGPSDAGSDVDSEYDSTQAPRPRGRSDIAMTRDEVQVPVDDTVTASPPPINMTAAPSPHADVQSPSDKRPAVSRSTTTGPTTRCGGLQAAISRLNTANPRAPPFKLPGIVRKPPKPSLPSVRRTSQSIKESLAESISEAIPTSSLPKRPVIVRKEGDVPPSGLKRKRDLSRGSANSQKKQGPVDLSNTRSESNSSLPIVIESSDDESQAGDSTFVQDISPPPSPHPMPDRVLPLEKILQSHSFTPVTPLTV